MEDTSTNSSATTHISSNKKDNDMSEDTYSVNVSFNDLEYVKSESVLCKAERESIKAYNYCILDKVKASLFKDYGVDYDERNIRHNEYELVSKICKRIANDNELLK